MRKYWILAIPITILLLSPVIANEYCQLQRDFFYDGLHETPHLMVVYGENAASMDRMGANYIAAMIAEVSNNESFSDSIVIRDCDVTEDIKKRYNLILLGGPVANRITNELIDLEYTTMEYWQASSGESLLFPNAFCERKHVIVIAGKDRDATRVAMLEYSYMPDIVLSSLTTFSKYEIKEKETLRIGENEISCISIEMIDNETRKVRLTINGKERVFHHSTTCDETYHQPFVSERLTLYIDSIKSEDICILSVSYAPYDIMPDAMKIPASRTANLDTGETNSIMNNFYFNTMSNGIYYLEPSSCIWALVDNGIPFFSIDESTISQLSFNSERIYFIDAHPKMKLICYSTLSHTFYKVGLAEIINDDDDNKIKIMTIFYDFIKENQIRWSTYGNIHLSVSDEAKAGYYTIVLLKVDPENRVATFDIGGEEYVMKEGETIMITYLKLTYDEMKTSLNGENYVEISGRYKNKG